MSAAPSTEPSQEAFETCYRDRQGALHHAAYLRTAKALLAMRALRRAGISLAGAAVLDFGFGAGGFLRRCPKSARLHGVEQDPITVEQVAAMLRGRGFTHVDLQTIDPRASAPHPLLSLRYDLIHASHVLEHLDDPGAFLARARDAIRPTGRFVGLVPCNERARDPHHVHAPDRAMIERWASAGWRLTYYEETDPFLYWPQPLFTFERGPAHRVAQALSLGLGIPATLFGERLWFGAADTFARWTRSLPTQIAFVMAPA